MFFGPPPCSFINPRQKPLMAVEARHNLFSPQFLGNREMMNAFEGNGSVYNAQMAYGMPPVSGTTTETLLPVYGSGVTDSVQGKSTALRADSGLTYSLPVSRKRPSPDYSISPLQAYLDIQNMNQSNLNRSGTFTFLGEDISLQIQQQQMEIDCFIAQHTEKVRMEVEVRRKRNSRRIIAAVEEGMMKRLRANEEEIEKMGKLNWALEEKVKSLYVENQIWRELAQTNEATANALRTNLEQVLAQVQDDQRHRKAGGGADQLPAALIDEAESCCGSNYEDPRTKVEEQDNRGNDESTSYGGRSCRNCRKEESCVLLLPCRHLCLCTCCASSIDICPICKSTKTASVNVNMSSFY